MKVALIGISGRVGSRLAAELLKRGHAVTGIARNVSKVGARDGLVVKAGDATAVSTLAPLLAGHDAVVSASRFQTSDATALVDAVKMAGVKRLLVVGGSGSLEVAPGYALKDAPISRPRSSWRPARGASSSPRCGESPCSIGPSFRHPRSSRRASGPARSGLAVISFSSTTTARAGSRWRISPSRWSMSWSARNTADVGSRSVTEARRSRWRVPMLGSPARDLRRRLAQV